MKLTQLAAKPQLVKITIEDLEIVKEYGEPIEFWIWDRQPMDKYIKLAQLKSENLPELIDTVKEMILDDTGQPILRDEMMLPTTVLTRVIARVVETLGK